MNLEERAGAVSCGIAWEEIFIVENVGGENALGLVGSEALLDDGEDLGLLIAAEDEIDPLNFRNLLGLELGVAACDDDERVGIEAFATADYLTTLLIGLLGYGAGVDDINVGGFCEIDLDVTGVGHTSAHIAGLAEIELTAERMESDGFMRGSVGRCHCVEVVGED